MQDFIDEACELFEDGLHINNVDYSVEIVGFSFDTPARAFIKCVKGHQSFYACERCVTKRKTVNKKRVYPSRNAAFRTKLSFRRQSQSQHHVGLSPLTHLPNFDPIKCIFIESLHLRDLGVQKWLLDQWLPTKKKKQRQARLCKTKIKSLKSALIEVSKGISAEFQRKTLNLDELTYWKGTQFRFFLLYCGVIIMRDILLFNNYRHYRSLVVAFSVLSDSNLATQNSNFARDLLHQFFYLLPSFYGKDSQVMNNHNLIHIADDVDFMKEPLPNYSAYCFENFLGY